MTQPIAKTFSAVLAPVKLLLTVIFWSASLASLPKSATNMEYKELDLVESWQTFKCIYVTWTYLGYQRNFHKKMQNIMLVLLELKKKKIS